MAQFKVKGILSYPNLFQPRAVQPGQDPKFSCSVLIPKSDPQVAQISQVQETEKANGFPSGFPANGKQFLKDCTIAFPNNPELSDYMVVSGTAKQDQKPVVVDANMQPVLDPSLVYAGAEVWVQFNSFSFDQPVNKGVSAGLNGVMITGNEGVLGRLDGRPTAEQMFSDVSVVQAAPVAHTAANGTPIPQPAALAPSPAAPPPVPASVTPTQLIMTAAANGMTYDQYKAAGWTDEQMIANGVAQQPTFA